MVVCKCRKATKLYCFVHKVPVCGECICFPEHQICVVRTYSEWVIDGEYNWPPKCSQCQAELEEGTGSRTTRLGCLHVLHTNCLVSHVKSFPSHTAPAGYVCPACSTSIWPPKSVKDSGSRLHSLLKEAIMQTGLEKNLFGNHPVSLAATESRGPPPAFASDPLIAVSSTGGRENNASSLPLVAQDGISVAEGYLAATGAGSSKLPVKDVLEINVPGTAGDFVKNSSPVGVRGFHHQLFHLDPVLQHERVPYLLIDKTLKCHIMQMMKMAIKRSTIEGVHFDTSFLELCFLSGQVHCQLYQ
ncbi:zinc finger protein-like 1 homolog isoform X3 [Juglans regia]|uniref:Zinc finger protein-like 1 homolog isoform X3 n=1 Tax=Juglans regia TaxID=51240 RepID=A0A6P9E037_JUGRE|nr:zinc finger protein-like 1 homolog isoform X3 [Juglans regia]